MVHVLNKGKNGEREFVNILKTIVATVCSDLCVKSEEWEKIVERNLSQWREGGCDIQCFGMSIEVKRREKPEPYKWFQQAQTSANINGLEPLLVYRQNRKPWQAMIYTVVAPSNFFSYKVKAIIDLNDLNEYLYNKILSHIIENQENL